MVEKASYLKVMEAAGLGSLNSVFKDVFQSIGVGSPVTFVSGCWENVLLSISSWRVLTDTSATVVLCTGSRSVAPSHRSSLALKPPAPPMKDGAQGHWAPRCRVGEATADTSDVFSARLPLVPTLSKCVSPPIGRNEDGSGAGTPRPWRATVFWVCLPCKLFLLRRALKRRMEGWTDGWTGGRVGGMEGGGG